MFGRLQGLRKSAAQTRATELIRELDLQDAANRRVRHLLRRNAPTHRHRPCGLVVRPEVAFLDEPTTGLDPRSRQSIWELVGQFKADGIATLLTTQYLGEADALSDRIMVIDRGSVVAEGTADELKERTGGGHCEIVPAGSEDLPAMVDALGSLLPDENRRRCWLRSDRITMPAPDGANTLVEALRRLDSAGIDLVDVGLRRPSLDDVFFALTEERRDVTDAMP